MADEFCLKMPDFHVTFRDLLHAVNIRHGTNGFTSLPKKGVLTIFFSPRKIRRLRPGLNPRTWVPSVVGCYQFFWKGITFMSNSEGGGRMFLQGADTRLLRVISRKTASSSDLIQVMQYTIAEMGGGKCSQEV